MLTEKNISDKYKYCEFCGRTLPKHYEGTLCPTCQEAQLFRNVRDYIRANTVNEYEVAEHFHIPLRQIKEWIREGRIEYHEVNTASTISVSYTHLVKELQGMGIQPDIIVCRSEQPLDQGLKDKIALFCNVPNTHVLQNLDVEYLYLSLIHILISSSH